ncbi:ATP-binding cassette domain-containing protein [Bacillus mangrovi]|uniref:ATP-binding cassette domain-containing protein n=1 Tax=Metabacillus mangrovi TaxID=1491830 RepID=A0A7X2S6C4_9BACI|nr:ABC transporter ATP-binding protein [Metabacillus mangrovi]MTH54232.1 ATP-binding cassette domain-containing protein [Metabacillus mangrovi]
MSSVRMNGVSKQFGDYKAVDRLELKVGEGEFFTFLGPSGCGKTTTLRMISGFAYPDEGTVYIGDENVTYTAPEKRDIGMVFQNYALFPHMNVFENVAYGLKMKKFKKAEIKDRVEKYLHMVELGGYESRKISELSGGQQQRIALARSLAMEPRILLLDEPLSNLDAKLRETMRVELKKIQKDLGITTIYVTHDQTEALTMSDKIAVFNKGVCQQISTPETLYDQPANEFVASFIGEANLFPVKKEPEGISVGGSTFLKTGAKRSGDFALIRPASISLSKLKLQDLNCFPGTITDKQFYGTHTAYTAAAEGLNWKINSFHQTEGHYQPGDSIFISIHPDDIDLVPGV